MLLERATTARLLLEDDERGWRLEAETAHDAARVRHAFRDYLETYGHPESDFGAAEAIYGELVANCAQHAPGPLTIAYHWSDLTLVVTDRCDRLRTWPYAEGVPCCDATHHGYEILAALSPRVTLGRDEAGGTRAAVVLPVSQRP